MNNAKNVHLAVVNPGINLKLISNNKKKITKNLIKGLIEKNI
jgi:hypothetical protein